MKKLVYKEYRTTRLNHKEEIDYLTYPMLEKFDFITHAFSTRTGGVSEGCCASMNFRSGDLDSKQNVLKNFRRICHAVDMPYERLTLSAQTHTTNVRVMTNDDAGSGIMFERAYDDVDGMITNVPQMPLMTTFADCVPLFFVDAKGKAIGLSHAGWRGTVGKIGKETIDLMKQTYGTLAEDIYVCIGPSICKDCYEVNEDVVKEFSKSFTKEQMNGLVRDKGQGKYLLDLWKANWFVLTEAGVLPEHIATTDLCTKCNPEWFFSHRIQGINRGLLGAFLMLK